MNNSIQTQHKQSGAVMMISAVMLIVIGMLTMSLMSMSRMQVHMAMNEEMRINAIQSAKSSNEAIIGNPSTTPVVGGVGYKLCSTNMSGCDQYTLLMPTDEMAALITSTTFTVQSTFDRTEDGQGNSSIKEGLIVMLPL
jgi:Tfp pilus assembly protein PilX